MPSHARNRDRLLRASVAANDAIRAATAKGEILDALGTADFAANDFVL
jgi:hypothetical protein